MYEKYEIAIIVPCYNCKTTLQTTVMSLLAQENICKTKYEIVLVDDGSTDGTGADCDFYASEYKNINSVHKKNGGLVETWKYGVKVANAEYVSFCDADDYISKDYIRKVVDVIMAYSPDIIAYGMVMEYSQGDTEKQDILLDSGYYSEMDIRGKLYCKLLSNGTMQSELILPSRCNKVFKKELLEKIMDDVPCEISFGEDDITTFAALLNCNSIYSLKGYYPYHYVRNNQSMTGHYNDNVFSNINSLYKALETVEQRYHYQYHLQVLSSVFSTNLVYMKKEFHRNPNGYFIIRHKISKVCKEEIFTAGVKQRIYKKYSFASKLFLLLLKNKLFLLLFILINSIELFRGKKLKSESDA